MNFLLNLLTTTSDSSSSTTQDPLTSALIWIIPIGLLIVFWVIQSRQRKKQQQEVENKMNNIKIGDVVKTIGLIYGEIVEIDRDMDTFVLKTGSEENFSYIKVDKMAIYQVIPPIDPVEEPAEEVQEESVEEVQEASETQGE